MPAFACLGWSLAQAPTRSVKRTGTWLRCGILIDSGIIPGSGSRRRRNSRRSTLHTNGYEPIQACRNRPRADVRGHHKPRLQEHNIARLSVPRHRNEVPMNRQSREKRTRAQNVMREAQVGTHSTPPRVRQGVQVTSHRSRMTDHHGRPLDTPQPARATAHAQLCLEAFCS